MVSAGDLKVVDYYEGAYKTFTFYIKTVALGGNEVYRHEALAEQVYNTTLTQVTHRCFGHNERAVSVFSI